VLASILLVIGYKLANLEVFKQMARLGWSQFLPIVTTIAASVLTDLLVGISIGLVVSIAIVLRNSYKNSHFVHKESDSSEKPRMKMTLAEEVVFLNKGKIKKELNDVPEGAQFTIDMSKSFIVDHDVLEIISDFKEQAKRKNIHVTLIRENGYSKEKTRLIEKEEVS
jgi:MFS superfamily sulfate permease-like transporter